MQKKKYEAPQLTEYGIDKEICLVMTSIDDECGGGHGHHHGHGNGHGKEKGHGHNKPESFKSQDEVFGGSSPFGE